MVHLSGLNFFLSLFFFKYTFKIFTFNTIKLTFSQGTVHLYFHFLVKQKVMNYIMVFTITVIYDFCFLSTDS